MEDLAGGSYGAAKTFRSQMGFSQPGAIFAAHFAAAKWGFGCENWNFNALEISQLRNEGMRLRNGTHVPRGGFAEGGIGLRNHFVAKWRFRSDFLGLQNNFAAKWRFRKGLFLAAKFRRPLNFYAFELLLILIIQKPILHQNKLELKH